MITEDAQVVLLLCSHLALKERSGAAPFTPKEWQALGERLKAAGMASPGELLEKSAVGDQGCLVGFRLAGIKAVLG